MYLLDLAANLTMKCCCVMTGCQVSAMRVHAQEVPWVPAAVAAPPSHCQPSGAGVEVPDQSVDQFQRGHFRSFSGALSDTLCLLLSSNNQIMLCNKCFGHRDDC